MFGRVEEEQEDKAGRTVVQAQCLGGVEMEDEKERAASGSRRGTLDGAGQPSQVAALGNTTGAADDQFQGLMRPGEWAKRC